METKTPAQVATGIDSGQLERAGKAADMRKWSLKTIRKAGATAVGNHKEFSRFAEYFLANTPEAIADRHYVKPSDDEFRRTLAWLGEHFELDTLEHAGVEPVKV